MKTQDIKLEIVSVKKSDNNTARGYGISCNRIYLFLEGEGILGDLLSRKSRPYQIFRAQILPALVEAGHIPSLAKTKAKWSQRCGCSCPCSPGFKTDLWDGQDIYVTYRIVGAAQAADAQEHILAI